MPYKDPPKEHRIKKGEVRNPEGGRAHNPELRKIKRLSNVQVAEIGTMIVSKNVAKLEEIIVDSIGGKDRPKNRDSKHSALKVWMARIAVKGIVKGDAHALDVLLNRVAGKVKDVVEHTGKDGGPIRTRVEKMTVEERRAEMKRLRKARIEAGED